MKTKKRKSKPATSANLKASAELRSKELFCRCPDCNGSVKRPKGESLYHCKRCRQWFSQPYLKGYWLGFRNGNSKVSDGAK